MCILPRHSAVFAALVSFALAACSSVPQSGTKDDQQSDIAFYHDVIDRVRSSYVEPVGDDKLVTNSLKGMLTGLDPHSDYHDAKASTRRCSTTTPASSPGIGAELTRDDSRPKVISPIDDTPAARAGIKPGDVILKIDGKLTDGMSLKEVVDQLRGAGRHQGQASPSARTTRSRSTSP